MTINVTYDVYNTPWSIIQELSKLIPEKLMAFDIETAGLYSKEERKLADKLIDKANTVEELKAYRAVASNSGLSFPSVIKTTHFVFGMSREHSKIFISDGSHIEQRIWDWLRHFRGKLLVHNSLFDLKVMFDRTGFLPHDYEDTALMVKSLVNDVDPWRAKVGLKDLMGSYYPPEWALYDKYEPEDLKDETFLQYAATDGAATYYLYELIQKEAEGEGT